MVGRSAKNSGVDARCGNLIQLTHSRLVKNDWPRAEIFRFYISPSWIDEGIVTFVSRKRSAGHFGKW